MKINRRVYLYQLCLTQIHDHTEIADSIYPTFLKYVNINSSASDMLKNYPPTTQGQWKCPPLVGGPAAVADALTHRAGATHRPRPVGGPARWAGFDFPTGINLGQCSRLPHIAETSALVTKTLV